MYAFAARRKQRAAGEHGFILLKEREMGDKRGGNLEMEHIFVTYLPIGWVQANKMEKVNVILRDEWISLDIYLQ